MDQFHDWTRLSRDGEHADCVCKCGTRKRVLNRDLVSGRSKRCKSCGIKRSADVRRASATTHGMSKTPEFQTWTNMLDRCLNPMSRSFHDYGGRGITVCDRWRKSFEAFYSDMGPRPDGCSIERRDNDGPYDPNNCFWATRSAQQQNKRNNRKVMLNGKLAAAGPAADAAGLKRSLVYSRLKRGWTAEQALLPVRSRVEGQMKRTHGK